VEHVLASQPASQTRPLIVPNRLAAETSPYLRQHADNPVDWQPWGTAAFDEARRRNVPVLLSVGYSSCHWCHVMAHECFEDDEVAAVMNELFVNVKVDREERPDVDAIYMDAVQALTGRGGWPMTVFMDAEGRPFFGGTYYPRPAFLALLRAVDTAWQTKREELNSNAEVLVDAIGATARLTASTTTPSRELINESLQVIAGAFDPEWGGFGSEPKFPQTMHLELILRAFMSGGSDDAARVVTTSLDAMAAGGIYDHIGGGFARYSTDRQWLVPHFEKMLYDQALLVRLYLRSFAVFGHQRWRRIVEETIAYVLRDLRHPSGGFFSAEDADSMDESGESHEGLFSTWTPQEVEAVLGDDASAAMEWWSITDEGNFEGRSIPNRCGQRTELEPPPEIEAARIRLFATRERRRRPGLDDKVLTEWNAMFISSLCEAAAVAQRDDWRAAAVQAGQFLLEQLRAPDGSWYRSWQAEGDPPARHRALAADHAWLVEATTRLYELTGQSRWIDVAIDTADRLLDEFWDPELGGVFTTPADGENLVVRPKDLFDGATPSANSTAAVALIRLAAITGELRYRHHADQILQLLGTVAERQPTAVSHGLLAAEMRLRGPIEIVITGHRPDLVEAAQRLWIPDAVLAWGEPFDSPLWHGREAGYGYICRDYTCQLPQSSVEGFQSQLVGPISATSE
jgi:uncharacterized protein YyaL (SSP411 family)